MTQITKNILNSLFLIDSDGMMDWIRVAVMDIANEDKDELVWC